jgi:trigger factor
MNVELNDLSPCKKQLRVELDVEEADQAFNRVTGQFRKQANLPGFRKGKAPRDKVAAAFKDKIEEEVKQQLMSDAYRRAVEEKELKPVANPDIEVIQFGQGQGLQFLATVETAPAFDLPDYKGLTGKRERVEVGEEDVEKAINALRDQRGQYENVEREVRDGDFVVANYTGTSEGKPLTDFAPTARGLTEQNKYWLHVHAEAEHDHFIPGFTAQLVGAKAGDKRDIKVDFPEDFVTKELAGRKGEYAVEIVEVKEKKLPDLDDEFAKSWGAEGLDKLREGVRADLENDRKNKAENDVRAQVLEELIDKCDLKELPEAMVASVTRNVVYDLVRQNQQRGVGKDEIERNKEQIYATANMAAQDRVKVAFIVQRVSKAEGIEVAQEEISAHIAQLAQQNNTDVQEFIKKVQENNGINEIVDALLHDKVVGFLVSQANIEEVDPAPPAEDDHSHSHSHG